MIEFQHISKSYNGKSVVRDISFKVAQGELLVLLGASGSGKTTLLKMINGLVKPDAGKLFIKNKNIEALDLLQHRRNTGYVIQAVGLIPHFTVQENIGLMCKLKKYSKEQMDKQIMHWIHKTGLNESILFKKPTELSGGQAQRVGIARALAAQPDMVLLDEPFSALDPLIRRELQDEFRKLQQDTGFTAVMVTHDLVEAIRLADKILLFDNHQIQQIGDPKEIVFHTKSERVKSFLAGNKLQAELAACRLSDIGVESNEDRSLLDASQHVSSEKFRTYMEKFFQWKNDFTAGTQNQT